MQSLTAFIERRHKISYRSKEEANRHVKEDESESQETSTVPLYILKHISSKNIFKPYFLHTATLKKTLYRIKVGHTINCFSASAFSCRTS